jgi:hypothetical protein
MLRYIPQNIKPVKGLEKVKSWNIDNLSDINFVLKEAYDFYQGEIFISFTKWETCGGLKAKCFVKYGDQVIGYVTRYIGMHPNDKKLDVFV